MLHDVAEASLSAKVTAIKRRGDSGDQRGERSDGRRDARVVARPPRGGGKRGIT